MPPNDKVEYREHLHTRTVTCTGYLRADGLWDIEGKIVDMKTHAFELLNGAVIHAGAPVHAMRVRITVDDECVIRDAVAVTEAAPYACCADINPSYAKLVGLKLAAGFTAAVRERLGGVAGCTHITELLSPMATTAHQTITAGLRRRERGKHWSPQSTGSQYLNTCYGLRAGGEIARAFSQTQATAERGAGSPKVVKSPGESLKGSECSREPGVRRPGRPARRRGAGRPR